MFQIESGEESRIYRKLDRPQFEANVIAGAPRSPDSSTSSSSDERIPRKKFLDKLVLSVTIYFKLKQRQKIYDPYMYILALVQPQVPRLAKTDPYGKTCFRRKASWKI